VPDDTTMLANEVTGVAPRGGATIPTTLALRQNYPNPFNPQTSIVFDLPKAAHVTLAVYDLYGRLVAMLVDGDRPPGEHTVVWDASGRASGVYFCRLQVNGLILTRKLVLMR